MADVLTELQGAVGCYGPPAISCTVLWRRLMPLASDREIAREQAGLVHRLRRMLGRREFPNAFVISTLENTTKQGLHGHIVAQCPKAQQDFILSAIEGGLVRRFGKLPARAFKRDGWFKGCITTEKQLIGKVRYLLKGAITSPLESGVRRGLGLRSVSVPAIKFGSGRQNAPGGRNS